MILVICRGLPSSGKSYRANELSNGDNSIICSADAFLQNETKEGYLQNWYLKLGDAHRQCMEKVLTLMEKQQPLIIVDNTNCSLREMLPYVEMARSHQYEIKIEEPNSPWWVEEIAPFLDKKFKYKEHLEKMCQILADKNKETHDVPVSTIRNMLAKYVPHESVLKAFNLK